MMVRFLLAMLFSHICLAQETPSGIESVDNEVINLAYSCTLMISRIEYLTDTSKLYCDGKIAANYFKRATAFNRKTKIESWRHATLVDFSSTMELMHSNGFEVLASPGTPVDPLEQLSFVFVRKN